MWDRTICKPIGFQIDAKLVSIISVNFHLVLNSWKMKLKSKNQASVRIQAALVFLQLCFQNSLKATLKLSFMSIFCSSYLCKISWWEFPKWEMADVHECRNSEQMRFSWRTRHNSNVIPVPQNENCNTKWTGQKIRNLWVLLSYFPSCLSIAF